MFHYDFEAIVRSIFPVNVNFHFDCEYSLYIFIINYVEWLEYGIELFSSNFVVHSEQSWSFIYVLSTWYIYHWQSLYIYIWTFDCLSYHTIFCCIWTTVTQGLNTGYKTYQHEDLISIFLYICKYWPGSWQVWPQPLLQHFWLPVQLKSWGHSSVQLPTWSLGTVGQYPGFSSVDKTNSDSSKWILWYSP